MKILYRVILIVINLGILGFAINWVVEAPATERNEPIIVILGQILSLGTIIFEGLSSGVNVTKVKKKSKIRTNAKTGDNVTIHDIDDSEVDTTIH